MFVVEDGDFLFGIEAPSRAPTEAWRPKSNRSNLGFIVVADDRFMVAVLLVRGDGAYE